jgi:hypothetical protein
VAALTVSGRYLLGDVVEEFVFEGTTYTASRPDGALTLVLGDEVRLHVEAGGWVLRGGTVGPEVIWRRGDDEREAVADGFTGLSPAYALAVVRRLDLAVGEARRLRLVAVTEPVLATRLVDEAWTRLAEDRWEATDLATGERRSLRIADGLVVEGTGLTLTRL